MHKTIACHLIEQAAKCPINRSDLLGCIAFFMDFSGSWAGVQAAFIVLRSWAETGSRYATIQNWAVVGKNTRLGVPKRGLFSTIRSNDSIGSSVKSIRNRANNFVRK